MTNEESNAFNNLYTNLSDADRKTFKDITIRLLKVNFLLRINNEDMYIFLINNKELLEYFFRYINFEFILREDKELAYIKSNDKSLINRLHKNETLCLLVLRLLYQEKLDEVSLSDEIEISIKELQDKLFAVGFSDSNNDRVKKGVLRDMLITFKQHNIIYYNENLDNDDTIITIYPSIEVCMDFKEMDEIRLRLDSLQQGGDEDE